MASTLTHTVDGSWLAAFRFLFGLTLAISIQRFIHYGWIDTLFGQPSFFFKYWGFEWVTPLSAPALYGLFWILCGLAVCTALGLCFRVASVGLALGLSYIQLLDVSTYLNHYYLAALLAWLLALSPANHCYSLDLRLGLVRSEPAVRGRVRSAWLALFRFQVGLVYFFAGLAKAQSDWLVHAQPLRIWLGANTELPLVGPLLTLDGVPLLMSWFGFLFDSSIVFWLSWSKTRPFAYLVVIVFHVCTRALFPIGMFPVIMMTSALVFFEPDWPRRVMSWVRGRLPQLSRAEGPQLQAMHSEGVAARVGLSTLQRAGWLLAAVYCVVQLALPLRWLAYGGNVLWHEQGMRFSWRVMVRAKGGSTEFVVSNSATGARWMVSPGQYLTPMQESEMSSQPDLIVQLARHIERDFESRGLGPVEVRAVTATSLNGRRAAPLIDPSVNLAALEDGLGKAHFVLPSPTQAPPHTRPVL